jgi:hypothetical protein
MFSFKEIELPLPDNIHLLENEKKKEIVEYLKQLDEKDKIAYKIAIEHLGTSFHIQRSNGFNEWKNKK